jgi:hypothetical protein
LLKLLPGWPGYFFKQLSVRIFEVSRYFVHLISDLQI